MTWLPEQAIGEASRLMPTEQDAIAAIILDEIDDHQWDEAFSNSQGQLSKLAANVRRDIADGHVRDGEIDGL